MFSTDYIYKRCTIRMSNKAMADLLYAIIITKSKIESTFTLGCEKYTKKQNVYNNVWMKIFINKNKIEEFESLAKTKLTDLERITLN